MDIPPPPPPGPNPQEESPRRVAPGQNVIADIAGVQVAEPPIQNAREQAQPIDLALFALWLVLVAKVHDLRILVPSVIIFIVFFGGRLLRSSEFLEATVIKEPLRPRDYVLIGMLVIAKFDRMAYCLPLVVLTVASGARVVHCLFPSEPRRPGVRSNLSTLLAVLWLVMILQYQWLPLGLFLGYVQDMPFTDADGSRGLYTGKVDGMWLRPHDIGVLTYDNGKKYTGYFENGAKSSHTDSVLESSNGDTLAGQFKDDKSDGFFTFMAGDRSKAYRGEMKDGKPNGRGYLVEEKGLTYEGEWVDGKFDGRGIVTMGEGDKMIGTFKNDKLNGEGIVRGSDGFPLISGNFKDGLPHGPGILVDKSLNMYLGQFENGKRHGKGVLLTSNGVISAGNWSEGELHGQGEVIYPGYTFSGQFKHGKRHGRGQIAGALDSNSTKYESEWVDGKEVKRDLASSNGTDTNDDSCDDAET